MYIEKQVYKDFGNNQIYYELQIETIESPI